MRIATNMGTRLFMEMFSISNAKKAISIVFGNNFTELFVIRSEIL